MRKWVRSPEMRAPQWRVIAAVSTGLSFRFVTQKTIKPAHRVRPLGRFERAL